MYIFAKYTLYNYYSAIAKCKTHQLQNQQNLAAANTAHQLWPASSVAKLFRVLLTTYIWNSKHPTFVFCIIPNV
jgi:hypothetical protein